MRAQVSRVQSLWGELGACWVSPDPVSVSPESMMISGGSAILRISGLVPLPAFTLTARTQLSVSFSQVRMQAKALEGPPRGPRGAGIGEPERALARCRSWIGLS